MRDHYSEFLAAGAVIVAISKDDAEDVNEYWSENKIQFMCLPDPESKLKNLYHQQSKLGSLPAVFIIDQKGILLLSHYATSMKDIPGFSVLLDKLP